jgi:hypothetical protein
VSELIAGLDCDAEAMLAAPAQNVGCVREWDGVVEFPAAVAEERGDWASLGVVLVRSAVLAELAPDPTLPVWFREREWGYRLAQRFGSAVRRCRGAGPWPAPAALTDFDTTTFHGRCLALPDLIAIARVYARHGAVMRTELTETFPALERGEAGFDLGAARLLMKILAGLGPGRFLTMWSAGELDSVIGGARGELESELGTATELLAEIQDSRAWRLAGSYYRARGRVVRRLGWPRR